MSHRPSLGRAYSSTSTLQARPGVSARDATITAVSPTHSRSKSDAKNREHGKGPISPISEESLQSAKRKKVAACPSPEQHTHTPNYSGRETESLRPVDPIDLREDVQAEVGTQQKRFDRLPTRLGCKQNANSPKSLRRSSDHEADPVDRLIGRNSEAPGNIEGELELLRIACYRY